MKYKLSIEIKKDLDISNDNINIFLKEINQRFDILNKELIFFNNVNIEEYDPNILNSSLEYIIKTDDKNFENIIKIFLFNYNFIDKYSLIIQNEKHKPKDLIFVTPRQISELVDDIDKLYYIRQSLQQMSKFLPEANKRSYLRLVKELSLTKYHLKSSAISLRVTNLFSEFLKIENKLYDYARSFGIELDFNYNISNIKLDKLIFYKIKSALINFLYTIIDLEIDKRRIKTNFEKLIIKIDLVQDFNKLKIYIQNDNLIENSIYSKIFLDEFKELSENEEIREQELAIINIYNSIKEIGRVYFTDNNKLVFSIKLDFLILEALIVKNDLGFFAIDNNAVKEVNNFDDKNISIINNIKYYKLNNILLPVLNESTDPKKIIVVKIKNQNFIFLVKDVLYEEEIFVRELDNVSNEYIGDALLKDTKRVLVINLKSYI